MREFTDKEFDWIPLYEGIASKLLAYKDRRDELVAYVKTLAKESNATYIKEDTETTKPKRKYSGKYSGKYIAKLVPTNPRRKKSKNVEGTVSFGYRNFEKITNGISYEEYRARGGRPNDLNWDIEHGHVAVYDTEAEASTNGIPSINPDPQYAIYGPDPIPMDDIDPFTVMGMFNRGMKIKTRKIIAGRLADFLGVPHLVPEHFGISVPRLHNTSSWFFAHKEKRGDDDIDSLWNFLETALSFAESNNQDEEIKQRFIEIYDKVIKQPNIEWNITIGLYWIRPRHYLTLDGRSRSYLADELKFPPFRGMVDATKYLALIDELKGKFEHEDYPVHSFPELSLKAYEYDSSPSPDPSPSPPDPSPPQIIAEEEPEYKPDDPPSPNELYGVDNIVKDGCFIARAELENILAQLRSEKNIILQGPPGTGKTWLAKRLAYALIGAKDKGKLKAIQFHSNISYEDFVIGYRPSSDGTLKLRSGPFLEMIHEAKNDDTHKYVVVIEEINRGNPARVFGEMLTLLEADKREEGEALQLSYGEEEVFVPPNLFVIGTMNIADRSLALVDFALRRRFAFIDLQPNLGNKWRNWVHKETNMPKEFLEEIGQRVRKLNDTIANTPSLGEQYQIGHSYLIPSGNTIAADYKGDYTAWYKGVVKTKIEPLLREYWFDAPDTAKKEAEKLKWSKQKETNKIKDILP